MAFVVTGRLKCPPSLAGVADREAAQQKSNRERHFIGSMPVRDFRRQLQRSNQTTHMTHFQREQLTQADWLENVQGVNMNNSEERMKACLQHFEKGLEEIKMEHCPECDEDWFNMGMQQYEGRTMCSKCLKEIKKNAQKIGRRVCSRSVANDMDPGPVPPGHQLHGLTPLEQRLIARVVTYVQVRRMPKGSIGYSGHSIHFKQDIEPMAQTMSRGPPYGEGKLPRKLKDAGYCLVRKTGNEKNSFKHKDFRVRRDRVLNALRWLKANNDFYEDIEIDHASIRELPDDGDVSDQLPSAAELGIMEPEPTGPTETGHKLDAPDTDNSSEAASAALLAECERNDQTATAPSSVVMNPITRCRDSTERERALNEIRDKEDDPAIARERPEDPIAYPEHDLEPHDETNTPGFLSMCYPALFPYGRPRPNHPTNSHSYGADYLSDNRLVRLTPNEYFLHLLRYRDQRFAKHEVFRYEAYSSIHRQRARATTKVFVKLNDFGSMTREELAERIAAGDDQVLDSCIAFGSKTLRGTRKWWGNRRAEAHSWLWFLEHTYDIMPILFHTESAADLHWPHLHRLIGDAIEAESRGDWSDETNPSVKERKKMAARQKAINENPHICAQYFVKFMHLLHHRVLCPGYKLNEFITRYEFAQRGMTHGHSLACFEGQPTITEITEALDAANAALDVDSEAVVEELPLVKKILDWVQTNLPLHSWLPRKLWPDRPVSEGPQHKPNNERLQMTLGEVLQNLGDDDVDIKLREDADEICARCNMHKCNSYCTSAAPSINGGCCVCRFGAPWTHDCCTCSAKDGDQPPTDPSTEGCNGCRYRLDWNPVKGRFTLLCPRNHEMTTPTLPHLVNATRANSNAQIIVHQEALVRYIIKYQMKNEKGSSSFRDSIKAELTENPDAQDGRSAKSVLERLLNKSVGERDVGSIEVHHILDSLPLFECNREFVYVSFLGGREVAKKKESQDDDLNTNDASLTAQVEVKESDADRYLKRPASEEEQPWQDYASTHTVTGKLRDAGLRLIPVPKPWVPCKLPPMAMPVQDADTHSDDEGQFEKVCAQHERYCQARLLMHVPWRKRPEDCCLKEGSTGQNCKCVIRGNGQTYAEAFQYQMTHGSLPKVIMREYKQALQLRDDDIKQVEAAAKDKDNFGVDEKKNKSGLDGLAYMDESIAEDERLNTTYGRQCEETEEDAWMAVARGCFAANNLQNFNADHVFSSTRPELVDQVEEHLFPDKTKTDWIQTQKNSTAVNGKWSGLEHVDLQKMNDDPRQEA